MALDPPWSGPYGVMQTFQRAIEGFEKKHIATDEFSTHNQVYLEHLLGRLDTNWRGYQRAFAEYETVSTWTNSDEEDQQSISELPTLARIVGNCGNTIRSRIKQITAQENQPIPKPSEIHLAKYDGDYAEWSSWSAQAQSSVLDIDIPIHAKIDLILQALGENIAPSIGKAEGRDQSELDRIWGKLQDLCSNPYDRARTHMGYILDLPVLHKPTDKDFRKMIDTVDFQLRALRRMDFIVDAWDPLIVEILLRKMDKPTIRCWERERVQQELPSLKSLLAFFERQVQSIRNLNRSLIDSNLPGSSHTIIGSFKRSASAGGKTVDRQFKRFQRQDGHKNDAHSSRPRDAEPRTVSNDTRPSQCRMKCRDHRPHFLWNCAEFRKLDLNERVNRISGWGLCKRCLLAEHDMKTCKATRCSNCEDVHNQMLCPKFRVYNAVNSAQGRKRSQSSRSSVTKNA